MRRRAHLTGFSRERVNCQRNNGRRVLEAKKIRASGEDGTTGGYLRRINAAIKGRECRVLAPLKRRLAPPSCNLRRDYDVRLRNPVRTERFFSLPLKFLLFSISIQADGDRIACRKR